jgi:hypothetical protein
MKKLLLLLVLGFVLTSCTQAQNEMESEIKVYIDKNVKYPESYESIDFKIIDTITIGENAQMSINIDESNIQDLQNSLNNHKLQFAKSIDAVIQYGKDFQHFVDEAKEGIVETTVQLIDADNRIVDYKKDLNSKEVYSYVIENNFLLKNKFGELCLSKSYFFFDKKLKIFDVSNNLKNENF